MEYKFNVKPSLPDSRDKRYTLKQTELRQEVDLREWDSLVEGQGYLGSCVSNAVTNSYELLVKQKYPDYFVDLSRLFVYYNTRVIEDTITEDAGVFYIRNSLKAVKQYGICTETLWPYDIDKFAVKPTDECYIDAKKRTITSYESLANVNEMLEVINNNSPIVIGLEVFDSFTTLSKDNSIVTFPEPYDESLGGHSMALVGYSIPKQQLLAKNSYGTRWGDNGYCWIPFEYASSYIFERWWFNISEQTNMLLTE